MVVPYWKATLELFEAFVNIDFDFASEVPKVKQSNLIVVEVFIVFRRVRIL